MKKLITNTLALVLYSIFYVTIKIISWITYPKKVCRAMVAGAKKKANRKGYFTKR